MAFQWELGGSPPNPFPLDRGAPGPIPHAPARGSTQRKSFSPLGLSVVSLAIPLLALLPVATARCQTAGGGEPRFGDTTWVAPTFSIVGEPTDGGPRVAEPERERGWETALRLPFRAAFYPLRLVARGTEEVVGLGSRFVPYPRHSTLWLGVRVAPAFRYSGSAGPAAGVSIRSRAGPESRSSLTATWSTKDHRRVRFRGLVTERDVPVRVGILAYHDHRPNYRFYGLGNESDDDRTIYLRRENLLEASVMVGPDSLRRVRAVFGISNMNVGHGYSDGPRAADVFDPSEVPFLNEDSDVISFGVGGDLAYLAPRDDPSMYDVRRDPSLGAHLRGEARRVESIDEHHVRYLRWHAEARGYLPVLSERRVLATRLAYQGTDPRDGSDPIPFYRLPESTQDVRFSAYKSHRFTDRYLMLGHAEYRWVIWSHVWALLFGQLGEVAPSRGDLSLRDARPSYGFGLRTWVTPGTRARLEVAWGDEGNAIYLDLKGDF